MSKPAASAKVMIVTIITKDSDDCHVHHERPGRQRAPEVLR